VPPHIRSCGRYCALFTTSPISFLVLINFCFIQSLVCLQCFGTVWLGVKKSIRPVKEFSDEVLAWLSVWSEAYMICIWSSWCHCHPIISCFIIIQIGLTFLVPAYPGCPEKVAVKRVSVCLSVCDIILWCTGDVSIKFHTCC